MNGDTSQLPPDTPSPEPRWPAIIAALAAGSLYTALPAQFAVGPRWLEPALIAALLIPGMIFHHRGNHLLNSVFGYLTISAMTLFMLWSLALLVTALSGPQREPGIAIEIGISAGSPTCWFSPSGIGIDAGGPHIRHKRSPDHPSAFLFPQMTLPDDSADADLWSPIFIDYLFLAFNTSAAFSPTDTPVLSRWAKALTMTQAAISLTVVAILAARAVNIL